MMRLAVVLMVPLLLALLLLGSAAARAQKRVNPCDWLAHELDVLDAMMIDGARIDPIMRQQSATMRAWVKAAREGCR
jgi:hypothetical protein